MSSHVVMMFFFKQKTAYEMRISDWSSDVCSSDLTATPALAQAKSFDVPAQSATTGIAELGRQADIQIVAARKDTEGKQVNAVRGDMTVEQALALQIGRAHV